MRTNHKEADNIQTHPMVVVVSEENKGVSIISDDTDGFVLLLHHSVKQNLTGVVIIVSPVKDNWHKSHSNWGIEISFQIFWQLMR